MGSEHLARRDRSTLNVFEHFTPTLPEAYRDTPIVLLANIAPDLQHHVLDQVRLPRFVIADTMDLWISIARQRLVELLARIHLLILNDGEARQLTGETSLDQGGSPAARHGTSVCRSQERRTWLLVAWRGRTSFSAVRPIRWKTSMTRPELGIHSPEGLPDTSPRMARKSEFSDAAARRSFTEVCLASYYVEAFSLEQT